MNTLRIKKKIIKCLKCNQEFSSAKNYKSNEIAKKMIAADLHPSEEQKSTKQSIKKKLSDFDVLLQDFKSNEVNFEI